MAAEQKPAHHCKSAGLQPRNAGRKRIQQPFHYPVFEKPFPQNYPGVQVSQAPAFWSPCLVPAINTVLSFTSAQRQETGFTVSWGAGPSVVRGQDGVPWASRHPHTPQPRPPGRLSWNLDSVGPAPGPLLTHPESTSAGPQCVLLTAEGFQLRGEPGDGHCSRSPFKGSRAPWSQSPALGKS